MTHTRRHTTCKMTARCMTAMHWNMKFPKVFINYLFIIYTQYIHRTLIHLADFWSVVFYCAKVMTYFFFLGTVNQVKSWLAISSLCSPLHRSRQTSRVVDEYIIKDTVIFKGSKTTPKLVLCAHPVLIKITCCTKHDGALRVHLARL